MYRIPYNLCYKRLNKLGLIQIKTLATYYTSVDSNINGCL